MLLLLFEFPKNALIFMFDFFIFFFLILLQFFSIYFSGAPIIFALQSEWPNFSFVHVKKKQQIFYQITFTQQHTFCWTPTILI